ncbi:MAG: hypothetical protein ACE15F_01930 [bacterium]
MSHRSKSQRRRAAGNPNAPKTPAQENPAADPMKEDASPADDQSIPASRETIPLRESVPAQAGASSTAGPSIGLMILGFVLVLAAVAALGYNGYQEIQKMKKELLYQALELNTAIQDLKQQSKTDPNANLLPELQKAIQAASQQTDGKIDQLAQSFNAKADALTAPITESLKALSAKIESGQAALEALQQKAGAPQAAAAEDVSGKLQEIATLLDQFKSATNQVLEKQNENASKFTFLGTSIAEKLDAQGQALADLTARLKEAQPPAAGTSAEELKRIETNLSLAINEAVYQLQTQLGQIQKVLSEKPAQ